VYEQFIYAAQLSYKIPACSSQIQLFCARSHTPSQSLNHYNHEHMCGSGSHCRDLFLPSTQKENEISKQRLRFLPIAGGSRLSSGGEIIVEIIAEIIAEICHRLVSNLNTNFFLNSLSLGGGLGSSSGGGSLRTLSRCVSIRYQLDRSLIFIHNPAMKEW
jgi:hypothetical protein